MSVPTGSPSRDRDVALYVFEINQLSLPTPFFYSVLASFSVFMAPLTVFHSVSSPDNCPLSSGLMSTLLILSTVYLL